MNSWIHTLMEVKTATQAVPPENTPINEPITCAEDNGVMLMYNGFGWGVVLDDGKELAFGWVDPIEAIIYKGYYIKKPEDVLFTKTAYYIKEVEKGAIVPVRKVVTVEVLG